MRRGVRRTMLWLALPVLSLLVAGGALKDPVLDYISGVADPARSL